MVDVLGYDIGGANTKAVLVGTRNGKIRSAKVAVEYFPVWKAPEKLTSVLLRLKDRLGAGILDGLGVTMTAELSDAYQTKREGVCHILSCVKTAFPKVPTYVLNTKAELQPLNYTLKEPVSVAAANWAATGWLIAKYIENCVVIDVGSTTTSIIPIVNSRVTAQGKTDLEKLICGELVYTGSLRTNVATIVQSIPMRNGVANVSSELFALSGDMHLILCNISEKDYTSETADGRGKTLAEASARLARVICADTEMLSQQEIVDVAKYVYSKQIIQVAESLTKVYFYVKSRVLRKVPVVVTGVGKNFLARKAAEILKVDAIVDLASFVQSEAVLATPAFGVALMTAVKLAGDISQ